MILICENCETRFLLSASQLGPEGRRVRCSHCGHEWYQDPPADESFAEAMARVEPIPDSVRPTPEGSALPVISDNMAVAADGRSILNSCLAAAAVFVLLFGGAFAARDALVKIWPSSFAAYQLFGIAPQIPGDRLVIDRITAEVVSGERGLNVLQVKGYVMNLTRDATQPVPPLRITLRRANGETIDSWVARTRGETLSYEEETGFASTYPAPPTDAHDVIVRFEPFGKVPAEHAANP